jgi:hypothetical protein
MTLCSNIALWCQASAYQPLSQTGVEAPRDWVLAFNTEKCTYLKGWGIRIVARWVAADNADPQVPDCELVGLDCADSACRSQLYCQPSCAVIDPLMPYYFFRGHVKRCTHSGKQSSFQGTGTE